MSNFTREELIRYSRQMMLPEIGMKGQEKIRMAKILVVGAGGLGCPALQYLCAAGTGTLGIIDFDKVELHNLHRQILFSVNDIGKSKAIVAAAKLKEMNPFPELKVFDEMLNEKNAERIISDFNLVIDASDNFLTRYLVNDTCAKLKIPLVYGSILRDEGQLAVFNYKNGKNLRDLFPEPPAPEDVPNCDENGVLGTLPAIVASLMTHEAMKIILGMEVLTDQIVIFDAKNFQLQKLNY
ncbi:MAG: HesA/MoeB/ThiF family protein [Bacteroidetes bacterium]|nr:HesA/MoeB/ThiF family protein [Bacteroidota bacterium]